MMAILEPHRHRSVVVAACIRTCEANADRASAQIVEKGEDYVLPMMRSQKSLREDVQDGFSGPEVQRDMLSYQHVDGGRGCIETSAETRIATVSHDVGWLQGRHDWPGLKVIGIIEAVCERKGKEERSVRHYIMSAEIFPERLPELTRNHWKIENCCLHWVLDVVMDEDRMQNRTLSGPECLAAIRPIALNIVRLTKDEHSLKGRMEIAAMSDEYLLGLLVNAVGKF